MRLLPFLLHAAAAKLQFGADANNTRRTFMGATAVGYSAPPVVCSVGCAIECREPTALAWWVVGQSRDGVTPNTV